MLIHVAQSEAEVERVREKGHNGSIRYLLGDRLPFTSCAGRAHGVAR